MKEISENRSEESKKSDIALREEEMLAFWQKEKIFEKSLAQTEKRESFVFYDGPPFATGLPHYGHFLPNLMKDVIPRYQTMRGRYVRRVWGWDCHGLPIENLIEKELNLEHKKDIEEYGIGKFNAVAQESVLRYDVEWKKMIPRIGRWVDMEHSYRTMDAKYTESIWWAFKTLYDKGLVYKGFKSMHICPRCETTLSSNEVAEGYKDVKDISMTVKFELVDEPNTFVLAWTTTPWTLPGNVALAVGDDIEYVKIKPKGKDETYIIAKELLKPLIATSSGTTYLFANGHSFHSTEIFDEMKGINLVGKSYKPIFDYYANDTTLENRKNGWKIYTADFVTTESGTGVVHIAPAFGEDDMELGKKYNLPFVQHVRMDGTMKPEVGDFAGMAVKPKSEDEKTRLWTDIKVREHLQGRGLLFSWEKFPHSYPHCWRCETPLLNYAAESWFVKVSALREKLLAENAKTSWVPQNMRDGRFGKWLENARDWAISRARYWGAPLPVWTCDMCTEGAVFGSRAELAARTKKSGNHYIVMRHGFAESNARSIVNSKVEESKIFGLTEDGRKQALEAGKKLARRNIDIIITSPFARARETAEIVAGEIEFDSRQIIADERIKEINTGVFNGRPIDEYRGFSTIREKFDKCPDGGETLLDVKRRVMAFLYDIETRYTDKTILVVTHEYPAWMLVAGSLGMVSDEAVAIKEGREDFINTAEVRELSFVPSPHNADFEFDMHRPYIDEVEVVCACKGRMKRTPFVFDCWFESGSMPFAQMHYPFENKELFEKNFPADFIAEGIDQTRGWFYNMLVLATGIFGKAPFKNVIVNGLVLAEDGQKMSKRLKNYPDPWDIINRYGADAVRYYLLSSPIVHAEDLAFTEHGVDEVVKKVIMRLSNVLSFYELYGREYDGKTKKREGSNNVLDRWILARLNEVSCEVTESLDAYELDRAVKPLGLFVDDLSTWYLRRSRDRFKSDDVIDSTNACETMRSVLQAFSKLIAPVMPFLADHIYIRTGGGKESVHLESWTEGKSVDGAIIADMAEVRRTVSLALEARAKAGLKVRQPLSKLTMKNSALTEKDDLLVLILDEVNVKEIVVDQSLTEEVLLDTTITPKLKREGQFRDIVRSVQELRKRGAFTPRDTVVLVVETDDQGRRLVEEFSAELQKVSSIRRITYGAVSGEEVALDGISMKLALEK